MDAAAILAENLLGTLATVNEDGSPWATPLHIFHDGDDVYWFSHEDVQHSHNIERDARVSICVFTPSTTGGLKGVYISGSAVKLDASATAEAKNIVVKRLGVLPPVFETATGYRLPLGQLDATRSKNGCWYFYS